MFEKIHKKKDIGVVLTGNEELPFSMINIKGIFFTKTY
jgi:hypothetical protein